ncbi:965_t:CDS:2, partial [Ambispora gerdemannii]
MNEVYTFTGELINNHLEQHLPGEERNPSLQPYCPLCYSPFQEYTLPFRQFWLWIETAGAKSYNRISQQTFQELVDYNYDEVHPTIIRQRIVRLLNTVLFGEYLVVDDQIQLINFTYERFIGTHTNEQNNSDNEDPEENNSNECYSETIDARTQTEGSDEERRSERSIEDGNLIDFISSENPYTDDDEEIIYIEETIINEDSDTSQTDEEQDDEPEQRENSPHEQENMANVNDVLNVEGHISTRCPKSYSPANYQNNREHNWRDRNNVNTENSHQQNNIRPNASNGSANNGQTNNNTNTALLMQIKQLTDALQNGTTSNNSLLVTHEYLAGERKAKITTRHNPLEESFNQSSEEVNNIQSSEQQLPTLKIPEIQETFSELFEYFQTIRKKLQRTEVDFNEESVYTLTPRQQEQLNTLLNDFHGIFITDLDQLGRSN